MKFWTILLGTLFLSSIAIADDEITTGNVYYKFYSCTPTTKSSVYRNFNIYLTGEVTEAVIYGQLLKGLEEPLEVKNSLQISFETKDSPIQALVSGFDVKIEGKYRITEASTKIESSEVSPAKDLKLVWTYKESSTQTPKVKFITLKSKTDEVMETINLNCEKP